MLRLSLRKLLVRMGRLELPRPCGHWNLKAVRPSQGECLCGSGGGNTSTKTHHSTTNWGAVPQFSEIRAVAYA